MKIKIALRNAGNAFLEYDDTNIHSGYKTRIGTHGAEASDFMTPLPEARDPRHQVDVEWHCVPVHEPPHGEEVPA